MPTTPEREERLVLLGSVRESALQEFESEVRKGKRNPQAELAEYRRRRRDYASWQRMEDAAPEARELAQTLAAQLAPMNDPDMETFAREVNTMLLELYELFIERASRESQGSR